MKKLLILLLLPFTIVVYGQQKNRSALITQANAIKNATTANSVTQIVVGNMFLDIIKNSQNIVEASTATNTDAYEVSVSPSVTSYVVNSAFLITFDNPSVGSTLTLSINGLTPLSIINEDGSPCTSIGDNATKLLVFNGSALQIVGGSATSSGGTGTVTSVDVSVPAALLTVSGAPITTSGTITITLASTSQNYVFAGPTSGSGTPGFRALVAADLPSLTGIYQPLDSDLTTISGLSPVNNDVMQFKSGAWANRTTSQLLTDIGTISIADGGTGQTTANNALNALLPSQTSNSGKYLSTDGTNSSWQTLVGGGTVTSVALSLPSIFSVSGSPVTTSGTLTGTLATQSANTIFAGPTSGGASTPAFRSLVALDIPSLNYWKTDANTTLSANVSILGNQNLTFGDGGANNIGNLTFYTDGTISLNAISADISATGDNVDLNSGVVSKLRSTNYVEISTNGTGRAFYISGNYVGLDLGGDATGDIPYRNSSGYLTSLGAGSTGEFLKIAGGLPTYSALVSGDIPNNAANTTGSAATLTTSRTIGTITGDATSAGSAFNGSANNTNALTLATVNSNVGSFGSATTSLTMTVNGKGLVTAISSQTVTPSVGSITGLGTGVATWLATPSWTNFNSAITGTAPYWALTGTSTGTGAMTIVGTTTNIIKYKFDNLSTTQVDGAGLLLQNTQIAASGLQQITPSLTLEGQGWKTAGTPGSQAISFSLDGLPVQGSSAPTAVFRLLPKVAGSVQGGYFQLDSDGGRLYGMANGLRIQTSSGGVGGISFNATAPSSGVINMTAGSFTISSTSSWTTTGNGVLINPSSAIAATSGNQNGVGVTGAFNPATGSATFANFSIGGTVNQTGSSTGAVSALNINTTYTSALGDASDIKINTTNTSITGTHYSIHGGASNTLGGVATLTPVSTWEVNGSVGAKGTSISSNTTLGTTYKYVPVDATSGNVTITLPTAAGAINREYVIWKTDATANTVTISTVNGGSKVISAQYGGYSVWDNGTVWYVTGAF